MSCCCNTNGSSGSEHNKLIGIQGGVTAERFHLTKTASDISERFSFDSGGGLLFDGQPVATAMLDSGIPITVMNAGEFSVETDMTGVIREGTLIRINNKFMKVLTTKFNEAPNLGVNVITVFPEILLPVDNGKNLEVSSLSQSSLNVQEIANIVNNVINQTLPANVLAALNGAASPSSGNVFVTESAMTQALINGGIAPENIDILEKIGEDTSGNPTWNGSGWPGSGGGGGWNPSNKDALAKVGEDVDGKMTFGGESIISMFNGVPRGVITAWYGMSTAVPAGWTICDGTNGTPDLRGRTIIGINGTDAIADAFVGTPIGTNTLSIQTNNMPNHSHALSSSNTATFTSSGTGGNIETTNNLRNHSHDVRIKMFGCDLSKIQGSTGRVLVDDTTTPSTSFFSFNTGQESNPHSHGFSPTGSSTINGTVALSGNTSAAGMGLPVDITPAARRLHYIMKV